MALLGSRRPGQKENGQKTHESSRARRLLRVEMSKKLDGKQKLRASWETRRNIIQYNTQYLIEAVKEILDFHQLKKIARIKIRESEK